MKMACGCIIAATQVDIVQSQANNKLLASNKDYTTFDLQEYNLIRIGVKKHLP